MGGFGVLNPKMNMFYKFLLYTFVHELFSRRMIIPRITKGDFWNEFGLSMKKEREKGLSRLYRCLRVITRPK